jgi:hypothetical protein
MSRDSAEEKLKTIDDCCREACGGLEFAEWLLAHSAIPKREIMQSYMIWKFKYDAKIADGDKACLEFVDKGYAKRFAELYDGRCTARTMYQRLFEK